jgi:hypothetical protein
MSSSSMLSVKAFILAARTSYPVRLLGIATLATCMLSTAPQMASQATHVQKLQQDIDSVREILAKDGLYVRSTTNTRADYKSATERKFSLSEVDGCRLTVTSDAHSHAEIPAQKRITDRSWTDIYKPDFSVMDPASVVVADPQPPQPSWEVKGYLVRISVEPGKPLMLASSLDKQTKEYHDVPGLPNLAVYVTSRDSADRLARAFKQLAASCHSNVSGK